MAIVQRFASSTSDELDSDMHAQIDGRSGVAHNICIKASLY